ncbi:hypothetical protein GH714_025895 [Hevea brasiliensis]|uniref:GTD-binding domain-containing protein n=1 Tax=Hevea brasiliensis TaxID=3981 RepID=A0A6A6KVE8_HEVBR|nr:hypothetical protein GH714_025895 [Hevea brasiliensis]
MNPAISMWKGVENVEMGLLNWREKRVLVCFQVQDYKVLLIGKVGMMLRVRRLPTRNINVPGPLYDGSGMRSKISEDLDPGSGIEDGFLGNRDVPNGIDFSERIRHRFELDGSYGKGKAIKRDQLSVEKFTCDSEDKLCSAGNDANVIQVLEQALEEEKAARAVLYQELEKERAAAATAADEAMAMILRLQEDKASIEMEARQYRVIEEKCAYDEEEMNILKEILVRKEREIIFLRRKLKLMSR